MDAVSDPLIERISVQSSAQIGKTEIVLNVIGYHITHDASPMLVIQPTLEMGQAFSKDRISPMLRDTPCLRGKVIEAKSRDSSNTILHKRFPGGHLTIAGANSPASLASRPVRIVLRDEVDRYPASAGTEGDPAELAAKRAITFWNRKILSFSTPTVQGISRIEYEFLASDQRRFWVPCPRCGIFQTLRWAQVKFDRSENLRVWYECGECKSELSEMDKLKMVRHGEWRAEKPEVKGHAGFFVNELYSPWSTWHKIAKEHLEAKGRAEVLRAWVNTSLGEVWQEEESFSIDTGKLAARREAYVDVPAGGLVLTAGVDHQDDRLECVVKAWGVGEESWFLERKVFYGSPAKADTWKLLDDYLRTKWKHESGVELAVASTCIDSGGHYTQAVYEYTKRNQSRRMFSTKGMGGYGRQFLGKVSRNNRQRAIVVPLGVDSGKKLIYDRLSIEDPGPSYLHFNEACDEDYFLQLTSEKEVTKYNRGFPTKVWTLKDKRRNEMLDCEVLNLAAIRLLNADMGKIAERIQEQAANLPPETEVVDGEPATKKEARVAKRKGRKSFVQSWRY
jgi:phage terminase large subunit GpA-like protein